MANYFVVTSAIHTPYSYTTPDHRFQQTLATIASIGQYCPDSRAVVVEVGPNPCTDKQQRQLLDCCFAVLDLTNDHSVRLFHHCGGDQSYGWVKTPGEIYAMLAVLGNQNFISAQDRVFKISGRYQLTSDFDICQHQHPGKLVLARRKPAVQYIDPQGIKHPRIAEHQYPTRLYSFCGSMITVMQHRYQTMYDQVISLYGRLQYVDVEHMMFAVCQDLDPVELAQIGVAGQQAPDGEWVWD